MSGVNESLGFLLGALLRSKSLAFRAILSPYKLTPRRYAILSRLWEEDGLHLNELAIRLYVDPSSLCRTLVDMEKAGFLNRRRDKHDRRVYHLYLTERGRVLQDELRPKVKEHNQTMLAGLAAQVVENMKQTLKQMLLNLEHKRHRSGSLE